MDPVPVFDDGATGASGASGATWLQSSEAVTITVPTDEKPLVSIRPQRLEVEVLGGATKVLDHELFAQVWRTADLGRSGADLGPIWGLFEAVFWGMPRKSRS